MICPETNVAEERVVAHWLEEVGIGGKTNRTIKAEAVDGKRWVELGLFLFLSKQWYILFMRSPKFKQMINVLGNIDFEKEVGEKVLRISAILPCACTIVTRLCSL